MSTDIERITAGLEVLEPPFITGGRTDWSDGVYETDPEEFAAALAATAAMAALLREAEVGRSVLALPEWWTVTRTPVGWDVVVIFDPLRERDFDATGEPVAFTAPTLVAAIEAALGEALG